MSGLHITLRKSLHSIIQTFISNKNWVSQNLLITNKSIMRLRYEFIQHNSESVSHTFASNLYTLLTTLLGQRSLILVVLLFLGINRNKVLGNFSMIICKECHNIYFNNPPTMLGGKKEIVNIKQNLFHPGISKTAEALKAVYCQGYP